MSDTASPRRAQVRVNQARMDSVLRVAAAWKRLMLGADGRLNADARIVMRDLFNKSGFYAAAQCVVGSADATTRLAAKRELVTHILTCTTKTEDQIKRGFSRAGGLDDEDHDDSDVEMTRDMMEQVYG